MDMSDTQRKENNEFNLDILYANQEDAIEALKDMIMFAGLLRELGSESFWAEPRYALDTLRTFELIRRSTFYEEDAVYAEEELVHRFSNTYSEPTVDVVKLVRVGRRFNWITSDANPPLRLTIIGKRLVNHLFRIANDSFFYHQQSPGLKDIYQAKRDLDLAKAYEDIGIGRNDTVASVLHNLENAYNDLRYQHDKYIDERKVLEKYESVVSLVELLENELTQRTRITEGASDLKLERQQQKSSILFYKVLGELSKLLSNNAYASQVHIGRKIVRIDRDRFLQYLTDAYSGTSAALVSSPLMILQDMQDGVYEEEDEDEAGIWVPFNLPFLLHNKDINEGSNLLDRWIQEWEPPSTDSFDPEVTYEAAQQVTSRELAKIIGRSSSITDELNTDTRPLVDAVRHNPGSSIAQIIEGISSTWGDVIRNLFVMGFLVDEQEIKIIIHEESDKEEHRKHYRWPVGYPDNQVRYVKGTKKLGKHLIKEGDVNE